MQLNLDSSCAVDFAAYFSKNVSAFELNLSRSTVIEVLEEYEKFKQRTSPRFSLSTLKYNINELEVEMNTTVMPNQITDIFHSLFVKWLRGRGLCYSSIRNYCNSLVAALRWATRYQCAVHPSYDNFNIPHYSKTMIALTPDEVSHISHFDISTIDKRKDHLLNLERVRDQFVLSCNLGQRYSDMVRISRDNFDCNKFSIVQQKTGNKAKLDIVDFGINPKVVMTILKKYEYSAPYPHDITNYNHYLHELLHHIGGEFTEEVVTEQKIDGLVKSTKIPKWKMISSHTARRTFITYNVARGKLEYKIRQASGHLDHKSFERYIILGDE